MTNLSYSYGIHFYYFVNRTVSEELYRSAHFDMISPPVQALPKRTVSTVPLLLKLPDHHPCNRSNVIVSSDPKSNSPTTGSRTKTSILVEDGEDPLQLVGPIETKLSRTEHKGTAHLWGRPLPTASIGEGCAFGSFLIIVAQLT